MSPLSKRLSKRNVLLRRARGINQAMDGPAYASTLLLRGPSVADLPDNDATSEGLAQLRRANEAYRTIPWPAPYDQTAHRLHLGDARDLSWLADESVHLVVTSPPYWTLKEYAEHDDQMGAIDDYEDFLDELDKVWRECHPAPCSRGTHRLRRRRRLHSAQENRAPLTLPLHADIQVRSRRLGPDCLTPILWHKIANGVTECEGNGAGFYGKPYQPGAVVKNDIEYILFLRKGGHIDPSHRAEGPLDAHKEEMQHWFRLLDGHPGSPHAAATLPVSR